MLIPVALGVWAGVLFNTTGDSDSRAPAFDARTGLRRSLPLLVPLGLYWSVRTFSGAATPATAPDVYQFSFEVGSLSTNVLQYLDRSANWPMACVLVCLLITGQKPRLVGAHWRWI